MNFIKQYLPVRYEFTGQLARKEIPQIPYEALREALINAVVHRDYFEKGANVFVEIFQDRIEISNPGGLVKGLTPENFGKISMLRNPGIANLFHRIDYIEKMGTGIERIRLALKKAAVPTVQYEFNPYYIKAVFPRLAEGSEKGSEKSSEKIIEMIRNHPEISAAEMAEKLGITARAVEKSIEKLKEKGLVRRVGPDKGGHWEIT